VADEILIGFRSYQSIQYLLIKKSQNFFDFGPVVWRRRQVFCLYSAQITIFSNICFFQNLVILPFQCYVRMIGTNNRIDKLILETCPSSIAPRQVSVSARLNIRIFRNFSVDYLGFYLQI